MSSFPLECVRKEKARWVRANQTSKAPGRCEVRAHWTLRTENRSCWNIYSHNSPGTPFTPWVDEHRSKTLFILLQKTFSPSLPIMLCDQMLSSFVNYLFNFLNYYIISPYPSILLKLSNPLHCYSSNSWPLLPQLLWHICMHIHMCLEIDIIFVCCYVCMMLYVCVFSVDYLVLDSQ